MINVLLVGAGGFIGAASRYLLGGWILHHSVGAKFPWSTFAVNVVGCLIIGIISASAEKFHFIGPSVRLFLITGLLGGFTTFSAFGFETFFLLRRGEWIVAALYAGASVMVCVFAVWVGFRAVHLFAR